MNFHSSASISICIHMHIHMHQGADPLANGSFTVNSLNMLQHNCLQAFFCALRVPHTFLKRCLMRCDTGIIRTKLSEIANQIVVPYGAPVSAVVQVRTVAYRFCCQTPLPPAHGDSEPLSSFDWEQQTATRQSTAQLVCAFVISTPARGSRSWRGPHVCMGLAARLGDGDTQQDLQFNYY